MSLLRRRSKGRSCTLHGDNGCEIQGEAGPRERCHDKLWIREAAEELAQEAEAQELAERLAAHDRWVESHWAWKLLHPPPERTGERHGPSTVQAGPF